MSKSQKINVLKVSASTVSKPSPDEFHASRILQKWLPLLHILRLFGLLPLSFTTVRSSQKSQFDEKESHTKKIICTLNLLSPIFVLTIVIFGGFRTYYSFFHNDIPELRIYEQIWKCSNDSTSPTSTGLYELVANVYRFATPTVNLAEWLSIMVVLPKIALYFNEWENFERQYLQCFDRPFFLNYGTFKAVCVIFCCCFPALNVILMEILAPKHSVFDGIANSLLSYFLTVLLHLEDSKISLTFYTVADAFSQIQSGIKEKAAQLNAAEIQPRTIRCWFEILRTTRNQATLAGKFTSLNQTIMTGYLSTIYTIFLFMAIEISLHRDFSHDSLLYIWFILDGLIRIYIKTYFADQISGEEAKIVELLAYWDISDANSSVKYEVRNIMDLLINSPSRIVYCGFITFDRRLILSVVGSVLTYLIVLLQVKGGDKPQC